MDYYGFAPLAFAELGWPVIDKQPFLNSRSPKKAIVPGVSSTIACYLDLHLLQVEAIKYSHKRWESSTVIAQDSQLKFTMLGICNNCEET